LHLTIAIDLHLQAKTGIRYLTFHQCGWEIKGVIAVGKIRWDKRRIKHEEVLLYSSYISYYYMLQW
jgi:hypothetical protein